MSWSRFAADFPGPVVADPRTDCDCDDQDEDENSSEMGLVRLPVFYQA